jgi:hypothetical protein
MKEITLKAKSVVETTSPEERKNNSKSYVALINIRDILSFNIDENLRDAYNSTNSRKKPTAVHKNIRETFLENPERFIQYHSGFTIVCDDIQTRIGYAQDITFINASLIDGGQTQGMLREIFDDFGHEYYDRATAKVHILVEQDKEERVNIAIARNSTTNVAELSKMGGEGYFESLENAMLQHNKEWQISKNETDNLIPTQTLLQVLRTLLPQDIRQANNIINKNITKSYTSKASVLKEYKTIVDESKCQDNINPIEEFYTDFAPFAWNIYKYWLNSDDWRTHHAGRKSLGKVVRKTKNFEVSFGVLLPAIYGLSHLLKKNKDGYFMKYPENFSDKDYIQEIINLFDAADCDPQKFAKNEANYLRLELYIKDLYG